VFFFKKKKKKKKKKIKRLVDVIANNIYKTTFCLLPQTPLTPTVLSSMPLKAKKRNYDKKT